jgi:hypothetical protein
MRACVRAAAFGLLLCVTGASAGTLRVDVNGGGGYLTIQEGMTAAVSGDTVLVAPGTYLIDSQITYDGKEVVLVSQEGPQTTIIDCQSTTKAVRWSGEGSGARLQGFTIRNGNSAYAGALYCGQGASPTISNCVIRNCTAERGGAIWIHQSSPTVSDCQITDCYGSEFGGGIYCYYSPGAMFLRLVIGRNTAGSGGGIFVWGGAPTITNCTFYRNGAPEGGAVYCRGSQPNITRCIIAFSTNGKGIACDGLATPVITHCDIFGNTAGDDLCGTGTENLGSDPLFCSMDLSGEVSLCGNSPCLAVPGHNPWNELIGAMEGACADCSTPAMQTTWGAVKALYR